MRTVPPEAGFFVLLVAGVLLLVLPFSAPGYGAACLLLALLPGLVLYLLFQSFNRQVMTLTPEERFQQPGARREAPTLLTSYGQLKAGSEQVRSLRRNLHRIRGLMDI